MGFALGVIVVANLDRDAGQFVGTALVGFRL
jgi:hypothetical protein